MNCICYNIYNMIQEQIGQLFMTVARNRASSSTSHSDDGMFRPNLNLLNQPRREFDTNFFFYFFLIIFAIVTLSSMLTSRRRGRIFGSGSKIQ